MELDNMAVGQNYTGKKIKPKMKQGHSVKNVQDYGSKKLEREQKQRRAKSSEKGKHTAHFGKQIGPGGNHQLVESITFGPSGAKKITR